MKKYYIDLHGQFKNININLKYYKFIINLKYYKFIISYYLMINISCGQNHNLLIEENIEYNVIASNIDYPININSIESVALFANKYGLLYHRQTAVTYASGLLTEFEKFIDTNYELALLYKPISSAFVPDYVFWNDISEFIRDKKHVCLFRSGINLCEALLYFNTQINRINDVEYDIYPIYTKTKPSTTTFDKYSKMLSKIYEGEKINYHNTLNLPSMCERYQTIIDEFQKKNIDLVVFDIRTFGPDTGDNICQIYQFSSLVIALNILQKNLHIRFLHSCLNISIRFLSIIIMFELEKCFM